MKPVNTLVNPAMNAVRTGKFDQVAQVATEETASHINKIFNQLISAAPAWRQAFPSNEAMAQAKRTWIKAFMDAGLTDIELIQIGIARARQDPSDFFPSPGKFIAWCFPTPEELGVPAAGEAYREACIGAGGIYTHPWSHPAVYQAGKETGWFELRNCTAFEIQPAFEKVYQDVCRRVQRGEQFNMPKPYADRLEQHKNGKSVITEQSKSAGRKTIAELKGLFSTKGAA